MLHKLQCVHKTIIIMNDVLIIKINTWYSPIYIWSALCRWFNTFFLLQECIPLQKYKLTKLREYG